MRDNYQYYRSLLIVSLQMAVALFELLENWSPFVKLRVIKL